MENIKQLVDLAYPPETLARVLIEEVKDWFKPEKKKHRYRRQLDRQRLLANIKPVQFGYAINWTAAGSLGVNYTLAQYDIPRTVYLIVLRVECYTVNQTAGAADYGLREPPPPGTAYWVVSPYGTLTGQEIVTYQDAPTHVALDKDEFLIFSGGQEVTLFGIFNVSPDALTRQVRTLCYAYEVSSEVIELISAQQSVVTQNP